MSETIDTELLRAFVTVVDAGGFSQAAERLMRGQSAVSLQIKRLETHLGVKVLDRGPRHVVLTTEGEMILDRARRILQLSEELVARAREPELAGLVRLGAPEDFASSHLAEVLARFSRAHPKVALEVTCELTLDLLKRFSDGGLDLALIKREPAGPARPRKAAKPGGDKESDGVRVWREPLVWVADKRPEPSGADENQLEALPLVVSPRPCVYRKRATDALDAAGRPWRIAYTCASLAGTQAAVRAGLGLSVLPKDMVPSDLAILSEESLGLPQLEDTEIALIEAAGLTAPAVRMRDYIVRQLELGPARD
ncbi:MAG: LysR substrate-binding domain-containing protein [Magnetovibrionaceae bacterium]